MKKERTPVPEITAKVYLVPHGYQIDFTDSKGRSVGSECRDFGGDYPVKAMTNTLIASFDNAMHNLEHYHNRAERLSQMSDKQFAAALERRKMIRCAILSGILSTMPPYGPESPGNGARLADVLVYVKGYARHLKPKPAEINTEIEHLKVLRVLDTTVTTIWII